jgi:hypothetical protein
MQKRHGKNSDQNFKVKMMKKLLVLLLLLQACGIHFASAQLSSKHYLPPLKKSGSSAEFGAQAFYLSTPETSSFDVNVYQGTNTMIVL